MTEHAAGSDSGVAPAVGAVAFADLGLNDAVRRSVEALGYETASPIQERAIPLLLEGRDIIGVAQTGTGKTAAFALPLLSRLASSGNGPAILCLVPTRELALQVSEAFQRYARHLDAFRVLPVYGGTAYGTQIRQLKRGVDVVVGTPGRVMDHIRRGTVDLSTLRALVLDEADEMLRMGFIDDVEWILEHLPESHQTALFSATMPPQIKKLSRRYLTDPAEVTIAVKTTTAPGIRQRYLFVNNNQKLDTLTRLCEVEQFDAMLVFVRTKVATQEIAEKLQARGVAAEALNGDMAQVQREKTVARLKARKLDVLVATDVAARGLDVERISHVINYDVPYDAESYVHRIGRTGRAGRDGDAVLFVNRREKRMLQVIERTTRQKIKPFVFPSLEVLNQRKIEQLFERIDAELQLDLTEYSSVVTKYLKRNEIDPQLLAAAIASIGADSKPFYLKKIPLPDERSRDDSGERPRGRPDLPMDRYRVEVGARHGVGKGDLVGAIANEAGIENRHMGKIHIRDDHSTIELPKGMPREVFADLRRVVVKGHPLEISRVRGARSNSGAAERRRDRAGRPGRKLDKKRLQRKAARARKRAGKGGSDHGGS